MRASFRHGMVIGKFYPPHAGHAFLIRTAAASCDRVTVVAMAADVESIPLAERVSWLSEMVADQAHVAVVGTVDNLQVDYDDEEVWAGHVTLMREAVDKGPHAAAAPVDAVFTSEPYGEELARRFDAADVRLDPSRATYAVSGTKVRADPIGQWHHLAPPVRAWFARRVVVLGAESTGTTTLSLDLAEALRARGGPHSSTGWVAEYGREYTVAKLAVARALARRDADPAKAEGDVPTIFDLAWDDGDFEAVALRQCADEDAAARAGGPVLICDTDALATTIWQERYTGHVTDAVRRIAATMPPRALYILTSEDGVAFEDDGLRDGEHLRAWMNGRFREVLGECGVPWIEVRGDRHERVQQALTMIDAMLAAGWGLVDPLG